MEEVLVGLVVARLAAEKGFNEGCNWYYSGVDALCWSNMKPDNSDLAVGDLAAPTQSFLQKWLRELKATDIFVLPCGDDNYSIDIFYIGEGEDTNKNADYKTYEEALEDALMIALKRLK